MRIRLWKEMRALFVPWLVAILLPVVYVGLLRDSYVWFSLYPFVCGLSYLCMSALVFGAEFIHGTMPWLLSQPISRWRIWFEKMGVLALALGTAVGGHLFASYYIEQRGGLDELWLPIFLAAYIYLATPALALILKNTLAAVVFTPGLLWGAGLLVFAVINLFTDEELLQWRNGTRVMSVFFLSAAGIAVILFVAGLVRFLRLESREVMTRELGFEWLLWPMERLAATFSRRGTWWTSLLLKELRLQRLNFLLALGFIVACFSCVVFQWLWPRQYEPVCGRLPFIIFWLIAPLTIGAVSMAEERQLGLAEWQLTLPPSRWKHWVIKTAVTLGVSGLLLFAVPLAAWLVMQSRLQLNMFDDSSQLGLTFIACFGGMVLSMYASSLCGSTLRAVLLALAGVVAIGLAQPLIGTLAPVVNLYTEFYLGQEMTVGTRTFIATSSFGVPVTVWLIIALCIVISTIGLLAFCWSNYLANDVRRRFVKLQWVVVVFGGSAAVQTVFCLVDWIHEFAHLQ